MTFLEWKIEGSKIETCMYYILISSNAKYDWKPF